ncbi:unnamed protein product [Brassicogethes aeneus]|uniref:Dynein heavy chain AAA module D4 domain-containing protein n=1 Tax=Brassicogethes aeneus TaxID=1431903 RepID=A0A9P0FBH2_BRAAE|nr:unnamed protein product [Brassicogethes aeneus]
MQVIIENQQKKLIKQDTKLDAILSAVSNITSKDILRKPQGKKELRPKPDTSAISETEDKVETVNDSTNKPNLNDSFITLIDNDEQEDLKALYRSCGCHGKGTTFIFTDLDIKEEVFLEYLNNILSGGVISNLFNKDEQAEIIQELIPIMKRENSKRTLNHEIVMEYFMNRTCQNLHVVFCFSPVVLLAPENSCGNITDEDSGSDDMFVLNNLPGSQLRAPAEITIACKRSDNDTDSDEKMNSSLARLIKKPLENKNRPY